MSTELRDVYPPGWIEGWISVSKRLPEHGVHVWIHFNKGAFEDCKAWYCERTERWYPVPSNGWSTTEVTHWMVLPPPPEETP